MSVITHGEPGSERLTASSPAQSGAAPDAGLSRPPRDCSDCPECGKPGEPREYLMDQHDPHWACWDCMRGWRDGDAYEATLPAGSFDQTPGVER